MLVPLALYGLTQKTGYLSPELAMGWQIGNYVDEFFAGLGDVRVAAARHNDAVFALSYLSREHGFPGQVTVPETARPWDFLFYHAITGTVLKFILIRKYLELSQDLRALESNLATDRPDVVQRYQAGLDLLIKDILSQPPESFCQIHQIRCRPLLHTSESRGRITCSRCGRPTAVSNSWDVEGELCCRACSGMEQAWFMYH